MNVVACAFLWEKKVEKIGSACDRGIADPLKKYVLKILQLETVSMHDYVTLNLYEKFCRHVQNNVLTHHKKIWILS